MNRKKAIIICIIIAAIIGGAAYIKYLKSHTFSLKVDREINGEYCTDELIRPVFGSVRFAANSDCAITIKEESAAADSEGGDLKTIGYLTPGMTEKVRLDRAKRYRIFSDSDNPELEITVYGVYISVEDTDRQE